MVRPCVIPLPIVTVSWLLLQPGTDFPGITFHAAIRCAKLDESGRPLERIMRAVLQRVCRARVTVDDEVVGEIGRGLLVLLGITHADTAEQARWLADKTVGLRIFADDEGRMNRSVADAGGAVLA